VAPDFETRGIPALRAAGFRETGGTKSMANSRTASASSRIGVLAPVKPIGRIDPLPRRAATARDWR